MSVLAAIAVTLGILGITLLLTVKASQSDQLDTLPEKLPVLMVWVSAIWACVDASRIKLKYHQTRFVSSTNVLFAVLILWIIFFPAYLVVRSRIKMGVVPRRDHPIQVWSAKNIIAWVCGGGIAIILATFLVMMWSSRPTPVPEPVASDAAMEPASRVPGRPLGALKSITQELLGHDEPSDTEIADAYRNLVTEDSLNHSCPKQVLGV